jgi:hypothetical protein
LIVGTIDGTTSKLYISTLLWWSERDVKAGFESNMCGGVVGSDDARTRLIGSYHGSGSISNDDHSIKEIQIN